MEITQWIRYQQSTANGGPRSLLVFAVELVSERNRALDLGAGALNDSTYLLACGFKTLIAIDQTPQFKELAVPAEAQFTYIQTKMETYEIPQDAFDLISAQFSLPFVSEDQFEHLWHQILRGLKPGGIFVGQLFGKRDDWARSGRVLSQTREDIKHRVNMRGAVLLSLEEREYVEVGRRPKNWHFFDLVIKNGARRLH